MHALELVAGVYLEGQGDLVSRLIIPIINLLSPPDPTSRTSAFGVHGFEGIVYSSPAENSGHQASWPFGLIPCIPLNNP